MSEQITLLINRTDIIPYAQIAIHAREETMLQPYILAAQTVDIKPAIGNELYTDLILNYTATKYRTLLEGGQYTNQDGDVLTFQGLKAALACYTYARYLIAKNAVDTPFGMVQKTSEFSTAADRQTIADIVSEKRSEGSLYLVESLQFLKLNEATYPQFKTETISVTKSIHKLTPASRI